MIINIVSSYKGGGAELLVRSVHGIYTVDNLRSCAIYLSGTNVNLEEGELVIGVNPRSPLNIFRIRQLLKLQLDKVEGQLIVHVHLTWPFLYVTLASIGLRNIRLIYTEHSTTNKRRKVPLLWLIERLFYARYDRVICISQGVNDSLSKWVGPKISKRLVTIPNGSRIYSVVDRPKLENRLPRLVSVGSLSSRKNFATAIRAVAQLRNEIDSYIIIGEGPERGRLEQIIQSEKLDEKVQLVGWSDTIESYLHGSDVQLIPSLWEGFGLVAVEGMSTGLPVVASNVDGLREVLNEKNCSVTLVDKVQSVETWATAIRKSISDLQEFGSGVLAESSRRQAEKFTLEQMAERYLEVYREQ